MKRLIMLAIFFIAVSGVAAAPIEINGIGSGNLDITYNNPVYNDVTKISSIDFNLVTEYDTDTVYKDFSIQDSYNYLSSGCAGTNPILNSPDWGQFTTTEVATGNVVYHDLSFEKNYNQYLPNAVAARTNIDFGAQTMSLSSLVYATGDWQTTQRISTTEYTNYVWAREYNRNSNDKMNTNTDFTAKTTEFYSSLGFQYVPKNVRVYVGDNNGASLNGQIGGVGVSFTGNLYNFDHTNLPTYRGFNFAVVN